MSIDVGWVVPTINERLDDHEWDEFRREAAANREAVTGGGTGGWRPNGVDKAVAELRANAPGNRPRMPKFAIGRRVRYTDDELYVRWGTVAAVAESEKDEDDWAYEIKGRWVGDVGIWIGESRLELAAEHDGKPSPAYFPPGLAEAPGNRPKELDGECLQSMANAEPMPAKFRIGQHVTWMDPNGRTAGDGMIKRITRRPDEVMYAVGDENCWVEEGLLSVYFQDSVVKTDPKFRAGQWVHWSVSPNLEQRGRVLDRGWRGSGWWYAVDLDGDGKGGASFSEDKLRANAPGNRPKEELREFLPEETVEDLRWKMSEAEMLGMAGIPLLSEARRAVTETLACPSCKRRWLNDLPMPSTGFWQCPAGCRSANGEGGPWLLVMEADVIAMEEQERQAEKAKASGAAGKAWSGPPPEFIEPQEEPEWMRQMRQQLKPGSR